MAVKKILVVDDSPTDLQWFRELLSKKGFEVVTAASRGGNLQDQGRDA